MAEPVTRETLMALATKGAFRVRLIDGRRLVVTTPEYYRVLPDDTLVLGTSGEGIVMTELDQVEAAEAVWPDVIELAPDGGEAGPP